MKNLKRLLLISLFFISLSCSVTKHQKKGTVLPEKFNYETEFTTIQTVMIIPSKINGISKNFIFDTGAQFSAIHRDSTIGSLINVGGVSERSIKAGSEIVESFKIGSVEFLGTIAVNFDMTGLKEQIPNFGGIIGQPIIEKANWLIDYPNKKLCITNKKLTDNTFKKIKLKSKDGTPYTNISISGTEYNVVIDFGSGFELTIPSGSKLAEKLLNEYDFEDDEQEIYSIGGLQMITQKVGVVPLVKLGDMEFENVSTKISVQDELSIGIGFFKNCIIYIDNQENSYKIKQ
ncbi:pepsin/retropepsin-like aspartic protease family protein [Bizionia myxarmorum]|uniref:Aspartyl protease n=1 Tax=Bizionia myxarmorum TaxID=291186 RepID=A0A5D0QVM5_9FLAO|nr:hypothetical protein [Bizionia myxarmorum]TYB72488.1 hypothetical protein ES674_15310 [Bizionia myxarmorum]